MAGKEKEPKWENVVDNTYRMKVHGGWIVRNDIKKHTYHASGDYAWSNTIDSPMCFMPDLNHEWRIEQE